MVGVVGGTDGNGRIESLTGEKSEDPVIKGSVMVPKGSHGLGDGVA